MVPLRRLPRRDARLGIAEREPTLGSTCARALNQLRFDREDIHVAGALIASAVVARMASWPCTSSLQQTVRVSVTSMRVMSHNEARKRSPFSTKISYYEAIMSTTPG